MVYNSKMWEPVSNWEWQLCRQAASLLYQKHIPYTSLAGLGFRICCSTSHNHQMEEKIRK